MVTFQVGWCSDGGRGMAVGMILCSPILTSVCGYKRLHLFAKPFSMVEGAKNTFQFLSMSFDVHFKMLD